jgi:hypothetical protein
VVQPRLQALNAYVTVDTETKSIDELSDDFFSGFCCIAATGLSDVRRRRRLPLPQHSTANTADRQTLSPSFLL